MNKVILLGRLARDPETRKVTAASGEERAVTRFSVAVDRKYKKDEADFINCVAFGKTAELIGQYLTKGRQIAVEGHLKNSDYTDKDGVKRFSLDVVIDSFDFISDGKGGQAAAPAAQAAVAPTPAPAPQAAAASAPAPAQTMPEPSYPIPDGFEDDDDDFPFA